MIAVGLRRWLFVKLSWLFRAEIGQWNRALRESTRDQLERDLLRAQREILRNGVPRLTVDEQIDEAVRRCSEEDERREAMVRRLRELE